MIFKDNRAESCPSCKSNLLSQPMHTYTTIKCEKCGEITQRYSRIIDELNTNEQKLLIDNKELYI